LSKQGGSDDRNERNPHQPLAWIDGSLQTLSQKQLERAVFPFKPPEFSTGITSHGGEQGFPEMNAEQTTAALALLQFVMSEGVTVRSRTSDG